MTRLLEFLTAVFIVAAVFVGVGCLLPSQMRVTHTVLTDRQLIIVYDTLNGFQHFKDWSTIALQDPTASFQLSGPIHGKGARVVVQSRQPSINRTAWVIRDSHKDRDALIRFTVDDASFGQSKSLTFHLEPQAGNPSQVRVTQQYAIDYGWNIIGRYAGLYARQSKDAESKRMLSRLLTFWATIPNVDYTANLGGGSALTDLGLANVPATYQLVVSAGAIDRDEKQILRAVSDDREWIKRVATANHMTPVGPLRIITNDDSPSKYSFDVAQPVQRASAALVSATDAANKSDNGRSVNAMKRDWQVDSPRLELANNAPVALFYVKPFHVAHARYTGPLSGLVLARNALRAWAVTSGYAVADRPYEEWLSGFPPDSGKQGEFALYWEIK